ncbi:DUF6463 family protein [Rugamonas aquatica]|uniref:Molecular chaperone GroEL n=1 Tax=Rugamonas aquatica TaxID=2743357 RepID=A0A6A7MXF0_9BURK|nr:DUF6463 family protein [Rugamonas aquatica]MQA37434.1 molecular chaperone GroEL [Rugamonas aquatica]
MKNWIGKWLMFVALGHTAVAIALFSNGYREVMAQGFFNTVHTEKIGLAVWFMLFGFLLFIAGMLVQALEKHALPIPTAIGVAMLLLTVLGVALMPTSGFWLVIPAIVAMFRKRRPQ